MIYIFQKHFKAQILEGASRLVTRAISSFTLGQGLIKY
jgi:hypothetical protein